MRSFSWKSKLFYISRLSNHAFLSWFTLCFLTLFALWALGLCVRFRINQSWTMWYHRKSVYMLMLFICCVIKISLWNKKPKLWSKAIFYTWLAFRMTEFFSSVPPIYSLLCAFPTLWAATLFYAEFLLPCPSFLSSCEDRHKYYEKIYIYKRIQACLYRKHIKLDEFIFVWPCIKIYHLLVYIWTYLQVLLM